MCLNITQYILFLTLLFRRMFFRGKPGQIISLIYCFKVLPKCPPAICVHLCEVWSNYEDNLVHLSCIPSKVFALSISRYLPRAPGPDTPCSCLCSLMGCTETLCFLICSLQLSSNNNKNNNSNPQSVFNYLFH